VTVALGEGSPERLARRLLEVGPMLAVVKLGAQGVVVAWEQQVARVESVPVEVVNGLGAGDAFGGAICHGLLAGWEPVRTVRFAAAAGAHVAARLACADAMPTEREVQQLLERAVQPVAERVS
jgi:5-dehydro-2-deoxygluconokinase